MLALITFLIVHMHAGCWCCCRRTRKKTTILPSLKSMSTTASFKASSTRWSTSPSIASCWLQPLQPRERNVEAAAVATVIEEAIRTTATAKVYNTIGPSAAPIESAIGMVAVGAVWARTQSVMTARGYSIGVLENNCSTPRGQDGYPCISSHAR